jgi:hypothetical protein
MEYQNDSLEYLKNKIDELRDILNDLLINLYDNELELGGEILKLSQLLDDFIVKYMKKKTEQIQIEDEQ